MGLWQPVRRSAGHCSVSSQRCNYLLTANHVASTSKLGDDQVQALHAAIDTCIAASLEFERAQTEIIASARRPSAVHNRTGEPCPRCQDVIREVAYNKYTVNYCATCQTNGKVLADNTTSKFLK